MKRGYFITGTDTGVGKTFVTAFLARRAVALGRRVFAFKPIETGCNEVDGRLVGADQSLLQEAAGPGAPPSGLYRFLDPVAPFVAARETGEAIDLEQIKTTLDSTACDLALVEGAGGWRVPITDSVVMAALAQRLALLVVLVARADLGTINHSLLSIEAIERDRCTIAAVVLSCLPEDSIAFARSNATEIGRRWPGSVLTTHDSLDHLL